MLVIGELKLENDLMLAPMAGITDFAFRTVVRNRRPGPGLLFTEMVSAAGLVRRQEKTLAYIRTMGRERPLGVQLFGSDPDTLAEASALVCEQGAELIDLNLGCPARKVVRTGAGAALLREPGKIEAILKAMRRSCTSALTVKMRAGWSPKAPAAEDLAALAADCGVDALTVHGRYAIQGFTGKADLSIIAKVKRRVSIPVIGNGDVFTPQDAALMRLQTGCDGIMIGRGAVGNPWIFKQISTGKGRDRVWAPSYDERRQVILEHYELLRADLGSERAARKIRGLLLWYSKGLAHSSRFRAAVTQIKDASGLLRALEMYLYRLQEQAG